MGRLARPVLNVPADGQKVAPDVLGREEQRSFGVLVQWQASNDGIHSLKGAKDPSVCRVLNPSRVCQPESC